MTWRRSLAPLSRPGFRAYWAGRTVSLFGNTLAPVAVAFAVLDIGGDAGDLGLVLAARGVDEKSLVVPEAGHLALRPAYPDAARR